MGIQKIPLRTCKFLVNVYKSLRQHYDQMAGEKITGEVVTTQRPCRPLGSYERY